ncbi:MAG TPA: YqgE/AlgH family protein, partial [Bacteroidia bacterium]|nr:YqgE/AlgH family protein [Bacteroidia bacterium]
MFEFQSKISPAQGRFLLAEPFLEDPYFKRSVIYLVEHNEKGSLGFILNKPIDLKINNALVGFPEYQESLYLGGPVQRDQLYFLHRLGNKIENSVEIAEGVYWGGDFDAVKDMIESKVIQPDEIRFFVGYAGWTTDQLNEEIKSKSWIVAPAKPDEIFNLDTRHLWSQVMKGLEGKEFTIMAN